MNGTYACSECGAKLTREEAQEFDGQIYCEDCLNEFTTLCDCCSTRIWRDNAEGDGSITLCSHCYEDRYTTCEDCGCLIPTNDTYYDDMSDYPYCERCYRRLQSNPIKAYSYKPDPIFYGSDSLFLGVELEIDKGGENTDNAEILMNIGNSNAKHIYAKHDGSIHNGFEIVSHPMTLDYHKNEMPWKSVFEKALDLHYCSHNTTTCGLHIHCNRDAFGETREEQEIVIGRILFFIEAHWNELVRFSRRKPEMLARWAARYATISSTTHETFKKAKDKRMGRYVALNLENFDTIEFRFFRGTLRYESFIAALQLVHEICYAAMSMTDWEMESLSWSDFVLGIDKEKYPELIEYLKSKRLYINEITEEDREEM